MKIYFTGKLNFTGADGDIRSTGPEGARIRFMIESQAGIDFATEFGDYGSYLNKPGQTSGTITIDTSPTTGFALTSRDVTIAVTLIDAAGNPSNVPRAKVTQWSIPLLW